MRMGIITGLSPQKKIKDRFNLYVDGEFLCGINLESIVCLLYTSDAADE